MQSRGTLLSPNRCLSLTLLELILSPAVPLGLARLRATGCLDSAIPSGQGPSSRLLSTPASARLKPRITCRWCWPRRPGFGRLSATHQDTDGVLCHNSAYMFTIALFCIKADRFLATCVPLQR
jgi:hypothetical protein